MMLGTTPNGSSIQIECKKRLFDEEDDSTAKNDEDVVEINERSSVKKQKIVSARYHRQIPNQPFVVLTSHQNERYYLYLRADEEEEEDALKFKVNNGNKTGLLKVSVDDMLEKSVRQELEEITKAMDRPAEVIQETEEQAMMAHENVEDDILWVEKFSPRAFCELLSDIGINRTLLEWLNLWQYLVYKKDLSHFRTIQARHQQNAANQTTKEKMHFKASSPKKTYPSEIQFELDAYKRPQQKVALLCGSPGAGKTTLAHVVARHAGYNVIEMNASDDRSIEQFRTRLETATQMQEVLSKEYKPNCLLIDEIDGAPAPSIQLLVDLVSRMPVDQQQATGKSKKNTFVLLRPVICICNDLYVPALRPLRQIALILNFPRIDQTVLAKRLLSISEQSNIKSDLTTMSSLCAKAACDIRSCLHFMQFVATQRNRTITKSMVDQTTVLGVKDAQKSLFEVWTEIFQLPPSKKQQLTLQLDDPLKRSGKVPLAKRLQMIDLVSSVGAYDKIYDGLFEHYLTMSFHDPRLTTVNYASSWLIFYDLMMKEVYQQQNYSFWKFAPYAALVFHLLFVTPRQLQMKYPQKQLDMQNKFKTNMTAVETMFNDILPNQRQNLSRENLILDILPFMLDILQPRLRQTNLALFTNKESQDIKTLIDVMITYNLTYIQQRTANGENALILEPPIDNVVHFGDSNEKRVLSFGTRQMIFKELLKERVKRNVRSKSDKHEMPMAVQRVPTESQPKPAATVLKLQPKAIAPSSNSAPRDFFAKFKLNSKKTPDEIESIVKPVEKKALISFAYNEGFSDAVRCRVKIQDLL